MTQRHHTLVLLALLAAAGCYALPRRTVRASKTGASLKSASLEASHRAGTNIMGKGRSGVAGIEASSSSTCASLSLVRGAVAPGSPAMRLKGGDQAESSIDCFGQPIISLPKVIRDTSVVPPPNSPDDVYVAITYPGPLPGLEQYSSVSVVGSWDDWATQVPLRPSTIRNDNTWSVVFRAPPGRYEFKFIRDGKWSLASNWETVNDRVGTSGNHVLEVQGGGVRYVAGHSGAKGIQTALADLEAGGWWENEGKGLEEKVEACQREYERALAEFKALSSKVDEICAPDRTGRPSPPEHARSAGVQGRIVCAVQRWVGRAHVEARTWVEEVWSGTVAGRTVAGRTVALGRVLLNGLVLAVFVVWGVVWAVGAAGVLKALVWGIGRPSGGRRHAIMAAAAMSGALRA